MIFRRGSRNGRGRKVLAPKTTVLRVQDQYPGETTPYEDCEFLYFWKSFPVIFLGWYNWALEDGYI